MREIINNLFLNDVLTKIDKKYYDIIEPHLNETFIFANFFEFPSYYKVLSTKESKSYHLERKLYEEKNDLTLELISKEILENNYNSEYLLFMYAYVSSVIFRNFFDEYVKTTKIEDMDFNKQAKMIEKSYYYNRLNKDTYTLKVSKEYALTITENIDNLYSKIFSNVYYFSLGKNVYKKALKGYIKVQKYVENDPLGINKLILSIYDFFTPKKAYKVSLLSNHFKIKKNTDLLNQNHNKIVMFSDESTKSFNELYEEAALKAVAFINDFSNDILYKKKEIKYNVRELSK